MASLVEHFAGTSHFCIVIHIIATLLNVQREPLRRVLDAREGPGVVELGTFQ